ncbi:MAG: tetratricopeptide repeat protein [Proteobacteria bacterium]|nr:tetratricopeptide repeat protein [Pseudomonadota bacterium]
MIETLRRISELLQSGQYAAAHAQLESFVAANPNHVEGLRLLAGTKQILGNVTEAEALLRRALEIDAAWPPTLTTLAELLLMTGRGAEAVPLLQRAVRGSPRAAFLLARHYLDGGQPAAALDVATLWINSGKADMSLAELLVAAYAALGRQIDALAHARRLMARTSDDPIASYTLALALNAAQQPAEGEQVARQTLTRVLPTAALYYTHARSLIDLERFDEAEQALRECVRLEPHRAEAHDRLAQLIWMRTGNIVEATRPLDEALARYSQDDALWATKAALLQEAGDARAALTYLSERAARPQSHPNLLIRAGLAALEIEPAAALKFAERALEALPANPTARKLLCAACLGVGDGARALTESVSLIEAAPDDQYLIAIQATALRLLHDLRYELFCDYRTMVWSSYLEVPAGWPDLNSFLTELTARLAAIHSPHGHRPLYQSLRQGTETTQDLSRSQDPVIQALFRSFAAPIARYREHIGQGADPLRRRNRGAARFNGSWSVRLHSGGYHTTHVHPRGWISSACYIQLPDSMPGTEGILTFGAPGVLTTPALGTEHSVRPEVGLLVLFPSYFWHGTVPFHREQPRLTVAFDAVPAK